MLFFRSTAIVLVACILFSGCSSTGTDGGGEEPEEYALSVNTDPAEGGSVDPASGSFEEDTRVSVEATAADGWQFAEWSGDENSTDNPLSFNITSDTDLTAHFDEVTVEVSFTANANPSEGGTIDPAESSVEIDTELSVEAKASEGWEFVNWTGDIESNENPLSFIISEGTEITGNFEEIVQQYDLTAQASPAEGGSVNPQSGTFEEGTQVSVEATANTGWQFTGWTGDIESTENPLSFTIDANTDLTANFEKKSYSLSTTVSPTDAGSINPTEGTFEHGTEVTIEATVNEGWKFNNWSGDVSSTNNPLTFTITENTSITGNFVEVTQEYALSVETNPAEGGSVNPNGGTFEEGAEVTVEATANEGWEFTGWTGDIESTENPLSVTMAANTDLTANFEKKTYRLTTQANPTDGGSIKPTEGIFEHGTEVTVEATPNEGWEFTGWTGDIESNENPLSFNINSDTDLNANFEQIESEYSFSLVVEDSDNDIELAFGQSTEATNGFDNGIDLEAPPPPPPGALNAFFEDTDRKLINDFRSSTANTLTWTLKYQIGSGDNISLSWSFDAEKLNGSVILTDESNSFQVDMLNENSFSFDINTYDELYIKYSVKD
jgi:uncharacterized repeat protein (TIGR02543 family)